MAWEPRGRNGRRYFYRKRRGPDGVVRSTYVGRTPAVVAAAELEAVARTATTYHEAALRRFEADVDRADAAVRAATAEARALVDEAMTEAGYRYHRGDWRRPRASTDVL